MTLINNYRATIFISLLILLCANKSDSQDKIVLSDRVIICNVPLAVSPNADGNDITLSNLIYHEGLFTLDYENRSKYLFTLVWYIKFENETLIFYSDKNRNTVFHSTGRGKVGKYPYEDYGNNVKGKIKQKVELILGKIYNIKGKKGTVYLFAVKGTVNPLETLPGQQTDTNTFKACSNVLITEVTF